MGTPLLCLVALIFMLWVIILKAEIVDLKASNAKLEDQLVAARAHEGVELAKESRLYGGSS